MGELEDSGTFDDLTQLGPGKDDIDRQLDQISTGGAVDDELAKMKAELGSGPAPAALDAPAEEAPAEAAGASSEAAEK
jgi:phage shock protein A